MSESQKTLLVVTPYFPPSGGGLERYAYEISSRLNASGNWRVVVATSGAYCGEDTVEDMNGIRVNRLSYDCKISNTPFSFKWKKKIKQILEQEKPALINIHTPVPGIGDVTAKVAGAIPLIVTYHTGSMHKGKLLPDIGIYIYEHWFMHRLLKRAKKIICSSDFVRLKFLGKYIYKSETITPAVDAEIFKPDSKKIDRNPTVLFVAGLNRAEQYKGLQKLLEAVAVVKEKIHTIRLVVVGDGDMRSEYEKQAERLGLSGAVVFTGRLFGAQLAHEYQKATVFALPTSNDSFSMVILEALATGVPVVSNAVGDIPKLVKNNETGILLAVDSSTVQLAEAIEEIITKSAKAKLFGENARVAACTTYSWMGRVEAFEKAMHSVLHLNTTKRIIGVVTPYYFPKVGGLENYALEMVRTLKKSGDDVFVVTCNHINREWNFDEIEGVRVYRMPFLFKVSNTPVHPMWKFWLRKIFRSEQVLMINAHTPVPFMADAAERAREKSKFILTYHNDLVKQGLFSNLLCKLSYVIFTNKTIRKSDYIIATSDYYASHSPYLKNFLSKIRVIPPPVDTERYAEAGSIATFAIHYGGRPTILFVSQLDKTHQHKGLDEVLKAVQLIARNIPNVALAVVGRGNYIDTYKQTVKTLGIEYNVRFEGFVSNDDLPQYYRGSDVLVLASRDMAEGFGMVILEAAACGTPAVGTTVGGIPAAIVDTETGLLVPPSDVPALAAALERILSDSEFAQKLGAQAAVRACTEFSKEVVAQKFSQFMNKQ